MRTPVVLVVALLGLAACTRAEGPQDRAPMLQTAKVPMQDALNKATAAVPGRAVDAELKVKHGRTVWEVDVAKDDGKTHEVDIDANTGEVVDSE